jgi:hypothetical protein
MPDMRRFGAARDPDSAVLRGDVGRTPYRACDQRAQRARPESLLANKAGARVRVCMLLDTFVTSGQARDGRNQELSDQSPLDDFALTILSHSHEHRNCSEIQLVHNSSANAAKFAVAQIGGRLVR